MRRFSGFLLLAAALAGQAAAQTTSAPAIDTSTWLQAEKPFRVAGPIHYVGTKELAAYLITTTDGHILLDGTVPDGAPLVEASIRTLGFDPSDIKYLIISQAHFDHVGSLAHFKQLTGAQVAVMRGDEKLIEDGGKSDYLFAGSPAYQFAPVKVDRVLEDGDTVRLGGLTLTARRTPGHTPGATTWLLRIPERGRSFDVAFPASTTINPGTRFTGRPSYPGIADDYRSAFTLLESLKPDIFLAAHASAFGLERKRARLRELGARAFVDPEGYASHVAARKQAFLEYVGKEEGRGKKAEGRRQKAEGRKK